MDLFIVKRVCGDYSTIINCKNQSLTIFQPLSNGKIWTFMSLYILGFVNIWINLVSIGRIVLVLVTAFPLFFH